MEVICFTKIILNIINKNINSAVANWLISGKRFNGNSLNATLLAFKLLIILKLENLYISLELNNNIADYVLVYNFVKKQSLFYILAFNKKNY